jgi:hypothetical protein
MTDHTGEELQIIAILEAHLAARRRRARSASLSPTHGTSVSWTSRRPHGDLGRDAAAAARGRGSALP